MTLMYEVRNQEAHHQDQIKRSTSTTSKTSLGAAKFSNMDIDLAWSTV